MYRYSVVGGYLSGLAKGVVEATTPEDAIRKAFFESLRIYDEDIYEAQEELPSEEAYMVIEVSHEGITLVAEVMVSLDGSKLDFEWKK